MCAATWISQKLSWMPLTRTLEDQQDARAHHIDNRYGSLCTLANPVSRVLLYPLCPFCPSRSTPRTGMEISLSSSAKGRCCCCCRNGTALLATCGSTKIEQARGDDIFAHPLRAEKCSLTALQARPCHFSPPPYPGRQRPSNAPHPKVGFEKEVEFHISSRCLVTILPHQQVLTTAHRSAMLMFDAGADAIFLVIQLRWRTDSVLLPGYCTCSSKP